jgi:hypothetical protein
MAKGLRSKAEVRAYRREYRQRAHVKEATKKRSRVRLLRDYGLTEQAFADLLYEQDYRCALCKSPEWGSRGPHIDHDHISNKVRGLLCTCCNLALGMLGDDADSIWRVWQYLRKSEQGAM